MSTEECSGECAHEQPNMEPELSYNEAGEEDDKNKEEVNDIFNKMMSLFPHFAKVVLDTCKCKSSKENHGKASHI